MDRNLVELAAELERRGIQFLALKGPVLARVLYESGETRGYIDVDLLVAPGELERARETLVRLGYKRREARGIDDFLGVLHSEDWYRREPDDALVDLHWRLAGCEAAPERVWEALVRGRQAISVEGSLVPAPGVPALALHAALHLAQHGPEDLKARADLTRAVERWTLEEWREAAALAAVSGATTALAAGLRTLATGARLADALELPETPELSWAIEHRDDRPRGTFHLDGLLQARGLTARVRVIRNSLFPTREWIVWSYPWAGRGRLPLLVGYARHIARSPVWAMRAIKYKRAAQSAARK